mgnify:CR=1 FL=1
MLVAQGPAPVDVKSAAGIKAIAAFAEGLGPEWPLVIPTAGGVLGAPTALVAILLVVPLVVLLVVLDRKSVV